MYTVSQKNKTPTLELLSYIFAKHWPIFKVFFQCYKVQTDETKHWNDMPEALINPSQFAENRKGNICDCVIELAICQIIALSRSLSQ